MVIRIKKADGSTTLIDGVVGIETLEDDEEDQPQRSSKERKFINWKDREFREFLWKKYEKYNYQYDDEVNGAEMEIEDIINEIREDYVIPNFEYGLLKALFDFHFGYLREKLDRFPDRYTNEMTRQELFNQFLDAIQGAIEMWALPGENQESNFYECGDIFLIRYDENDFIFIWSLESTFLY